MRRASASSERKQRRPRERRPVAGSETSTNSLLELQTVKTGVPVSARATSSGASAREREAEAPCGPGGAADAVTAARAGRGGAAKRDARRERWWWRKEEAAARGLGGSDEEEEEEEGAYGSDEEGVEAVGGGEGDEDELAIARLGLPEQLVSTLEKRGITHLFPIQVMPICAPFRVLDSLTVLDVKLQVSVLGGDSEGIGVSVGFVGGMSSW